MARKLKCQWCGDKSVKEEMVQVTKGKVNKYYHASECYDEFLAEEKFKQVEAEQKDSLSRTVMDIYDVKALPPSFYMRIEGLRHGNQVFNKQRMGKRYREGYTYDLIEETYKDSRDAIEWSLRNKAFVNMANALNYGMSIIINNIYNVERKRDAVASKNHFRELSENTEEFDDIDIEFDNSYKKNTDTDEDFFAMLDE